MFRFWKLAQYIINGQLVWCHDCLSSSTQSSIGPSTNHQVSPVCNCGSICTLGAPSNISCTKVFCHIFLASQWFVLFFSSLPSYLFVLSLLWGPRACRMTQPRKCRFRWQELPRSRIAGCRKFLPFLLWLIHSHNKTINRFMGLRFRRLRCVIVYTWTQFYNFSFWFSGNNSNFSFVRPCKRKGRLRWIEKREENCNLYFFIILDKLFSNSRVGIYQAPFSSLQRYAQWSNYHCGPLQCTQFQP